MNCNDGKVNLNEGCFDQWVKNIHEDDPVKQLDSTLNLRRLLSLEVNPHIQQVIESGVVDRLIEFLDYNDNPRLQFEATWAITNITSGTSEQTNYVIEKGAIPHIIELLKSVHMDIIEQAVWALGNIAGDSHRSRDLLINKGVIDNIMPLFKHEKLMRTLTWMVSNLCRGKPQPDFEKVHVFVDPLSVLIESNDNEIVCDALWALSYLSDGPASQIQVIIEKGVCQKVLKHLTSKEYSVTNPSLRIFGNVFSGSDIQTQFLIDLNILNHVMSFLFSSKKAVVKECCWIISNITAGNHIQIQYVINLNIFPILIDIMNNGDYELKKEACTAVSNASFKGTQQQLEYLFNIGCLFPICNLISSTDHIIAMTCLECLENFLKTNESGSVNKCVMFLEENNFLDKLEELSLMENGNISNKSNHILNIFFKPGLGEMVN